MKFPIQSNIQQQRYQPFEALQMEIHQFRVVQSVNSRPLNSSCYDICERLYPPGSERNDCYQKCR